MSYRMSLQLASIISVISSPKKHSFSAVKRKQTSQEDTRIYSNRNLPPEDVVSIDGLPVTSVERTVADLAANKIERNYLATLAADALRKEGVRFRTLASYLDPYAAFYRSTSGEELLHEFQTEASSMKTEMIYSTAFPKNGQKGI